MVGMNGNLDNIYARHSDMLELFIKIIGTIKCVIIILIILKK